VILVITFLTPMTLPISAYAIPVIIGGFTLRARPLGLLVAMVTAFAAISLSLTTHHTSWVYQQAVNAAMVVVAAAIVLWVASQDRSGLPGRLGQDMLMELNERLQVQGNVPELPAGWQAQSLLQSAGGAKFAGDFFIAHLHESGDVLELVLVDVSGKGVGAGTKSLQFAGALGGPRQQGGTPRHHRARLGHRIVRHEIAPGETDVREIAAQGSPPRLRPGLRAGQRINVARSGFGRGLHGGPLDAAGQGGKRCPPR
jgi:hypothetical protein